VRRSDAKVLDIGRRCRFDSTCEAEAEGNIHGRKERWKDQQKEQSRGEVGRSGNGKERSEGMMQNISSLCADRQFKHV
jgi:hypothetical protein